MKLVTRKARTAGIVATGTLFPWDERISARANVTARRTAAVMGHVKGTPAVSKALRQFRLWVNTTVILSGIVAVLAVSTDWFGLYG